MHSPTLIGSAALDEASVSDWYLWPAIVAVAVPLVVAGLQILQDYLKDRRRPADTKVALDTLRETNKDLRDLIRGLRDSVKQLTTSVTALAESVVASRSVEQEK